MNIATALNQKYVRYAGVMLYSLAVNNPCHINAYLLHSELTEEDLAYLDSCVQSYDIDLIPLAVNRNLFSDRLPHTEQWSMEAYYRLLLMDLLPEETERLLYLDVDVIVIASLDSFYQSVLDGYDLIACEDASGKKEMHSYGPKHLEMFAPMIQQGGRYFCSGVLLLHIALMRKKYSFDTYLNAMKEWDYGMEAPDQDLLNWVHWQYTCFADPFKYNLFARIAHNDGLTCEQVKQTCAILHFAGDKPWESTNVHYDIERIWWDYARETPAYESLLSDFLESSLRDYGRVENYILQLEAHNRELKQNLDKLIGIVKRIVPDA